MSQRKSGHARRKHDLYETPAWVVTDGLGHHYSLAGLRVLEPACGSGLMARAIESLGAVYVLAADVVKHRRFPRTNATLRCAANFQRRDFLKHKPSNPDFFDAIITNPPYGRNGALAIAFIKRGIELLGYGMPNRTFDGRYRFLALLLPVDFDSGATRADLFENCALFEAKIVLRKRIEWFKSKSGAGPSANHAWFIWGNMPRAPGVAPKLLYAPTRYRGGTRFQFLSVSEVRKQSGIKIEEVDVYDPAIRHG